MEPNQNKPANGSNYAKRPLWQWVLIYIVVAAVVYALAFVVYKQFIQDDSSSDSTTPSSLY